MRLLVVLTQAAPCKLYPQGFIKKVGALGVSAFFVVLRLGVRVAVGWVGHICKAWKVASTLGSVGFVCFCRPVVRKLIFFRKPVSSSVLLRRST